MKLIPATTEQDLNRVRNLYMVSFPDSERKPFDMILAMHETGNADILMMMDPDFSGLLITMKDDGLLLIDYLAVDPAIHSQGHGSRALTAFEALYPGQRVVLEIENPDKAPEGSPERRRLSFYQNNGFSVMNTGIRLFDVPMKLLVRNGSVTYEDYKAFLIRRLGP